jgi:enoyl-CoA hydratase/carnithine racemase
VTTGLVSFKTDGRIAIVTLERPEALNAISGALADDLAGALRAATDDPDVWVVVLTAAGEKAFCVGADLKERAAFSLDDFYANREKVRAMFAALRAVPHPTVASVFGFALGGGFELALSCDLIVAAEGVTMGLPEVRVGLLPAGGGTQLLTRRVGLGRAKEMIFRGRLIDAAEAEQLGIANRVVARAELEDATMELARDVCKSSPIAVREAKRAIDSAFGLFDIGIQIEHDGWRRVIVTEDRAEGIAAFNDKRDPVWRNK